MKIRFIVIATAALLALHQSASAQTAPADGMSAGDTPQAQKQGVQDEATLPQPAQAPAQDASPASAPAANQPPPTVKTTKFDDWVLRCVTPAGADAAATQCEVVQAVQIDSNGQKLPLLTIAFAKVNVSDTADAQKPAKSSIVMTTIVPENMLLPPGLTLLDGQKELKKLPYRNCNQAGCWTQSIADDAFLKSFAASKEAVARMQLMNGKVVNLKYSVAGLSAAMVELNKQSK